MSNLFQLTDDQWRKIEPLIPMSRPGPKPKRNREILSGILHVQKTGCRWQDCPKAYGPHTTAKAHRCSAGATYGPPRLQTVSAIRSEQSASTYPVSGSNPGQDGDPRVPSLIKGPASSAILHHRLTGHRLTVRPSCFHHPQTLSRLAASGDRYGPIRTMPPLPCWRRTSSRCAAVPTRSAPACLPMRQRPCCRAFGRADRATTHQVASTFWRALAKLPAPPG